METALRLSSGKWAHVHYFLRKCKCWLQTLFAFQRQVMFCSSVTILSRLCRCHLWKMGCQVKMDTIIILRSFSHRISNAFWLKCKGRLSSVSRKYSQHFYPLPAAEKHPPQIDAATSTLHSRDGVHVWHSHQRAQSLSHQTKQFSSSWSERPSGDSRWAATQAWLVDGCRDGCPSGRLYSESSSRVAVGF